MSGKLFLKNRLPVILLNLLGALALSLFLLAVGNDIQTILFILAAWMLVLALYLAAGYASRKKRLEKLLEMATQLKERYLLPEVMPVPDQAEEQVYYQLLKLAGKSMLERIGEVERERGEYRTYIEQWVHEVKTPITALKLLCENNRSPFSREVLAELENINRCAEQALYYARSEHTEKDYSIREMSLADVVHGAIADNKYLLRQCDMAITVDDLEPVVYADDKWVRFILNQIISNAVKYRSPEQPVLHIFTERSGDQVLLSVADNGIGIPESDLPRIFEKGFTGQNGRTIHSSTGIGLYLCKRLCDKLGIGLAASSVGQREPPSPSPSISTTLSQGCRADRLCTSYIFVRTVKEKLIQKRPRGRYNRGKKRTWEAGHMEPILKLEHIQKYYGNGGNVTKAIQDISFSVCGRGVPGDHGGLRLRQDHPAQLHLHH